MFNLIYFGGKKLKKECKENIWIFDKMEAQI